MRWSVAIAGSTLGDLRAVLLTHGHADHTGFAERARTELGVPVAIHTPGHTKGHTSFLLPERDVLVAGDALVTNDLYTGRLGPRMIARGRDVELRGRSTLARPPRDGGGGDAGVAERRSYVGEVDVFIVYCPDLDRIYAIPVDDVPLSEGSLRVEPTANGQKKGIRWAADYELPA